MSALIFSLTKQRLYNDFAYDRIIGILQNWIDLQDWSIELIIVILNERYYR